MFRSDGVPLPRTVPIAHPLNTFRHIVAELIYPEPLNIPAEFDQAHVAELIAAKKLANAGFIIKTQTLEIITAQSTQQGGWFRQPWHLLSGTSRLFGDEPPIGIILTC